MKQNTSLFPRPFGLDAMALVIAATAVTSNAFTQPCVLGSDLEVGSANCPDFSFITLGDSMDDLLRQTWSEEQPL